MIIAHRSPHQTLGIMAGRASTNHDNHHLATQIINSNHHTSKRVIIVTTMLESLMPMIAMTKRSIKIPKLGIHDAMGKKTQK